MTGSAASEPIAARVAALHWGDIAADLDATGCALAGPVLEEDECRALVDGFDDDGRYRSTIDMARYRYGSGVYRYFGRPLPPVVQALRASCWPQLLPIARDWWSRLGREAAWPDDLDDWLDRCHAAGQTRPTPLVLRYGAGDWNALHRDLYGDLVFPLQVVVGLDHPGAESQGGAYEGGEFLVVEQRPRAQSRATVLTIPRGHAVVFTTQDRPIRSTRGWTAAPLRHGVSTVRSGTRHTLGVLFHDAS